MRNEEDFIIANDILDGDLCLPPQNRVQKESKKGRKQALSAFSFNCSIITLGGIMLNVRTHSFMALWVSMALLFSGTISAQVERPVGINLSPVSDFSTEFVFVDAFKQSRSWISHNADGSGPWDTGVSIPLSENGYPLSIPYDDGVNPPQRVRSLLLWDLVEPFPAGTYRLMVEGEGQVSLEFGATGTFSCPVDTLVAISSALAIRIDASTASNPISSIRLIRPEYIDQPDAQTFTSDFLEFLEDFQVIRFMDWMQTNNSPISQWTERTLPETYTQTLNTGVAYEYIAELANFLEKDIWVNIPHMADDDYVLTFANFLQANLDGDIRVYLEYSNELWNGIFSQTSYASAMGEELGFTGPSWEQGWKYTVYRSVEVFSLFESVFTDGDRLVKIIPSQSANPWLSEQLVNYLDDQLYNPSDIEADALAIAPYFASNVANEIVEDDVVSSISVEGVVERMSESLSLASAEINDNMAVAEAAGLDLVAYEGGQHLLGTGGNENIDELTQKLIAANHHPALQSVYCDYFDSWYESGGGLFAHFNSHYPYSKWGSWGLKETMSDFDNPKYLALQECVFEVNVLSSTGQSAEVQLQVFPNPSKSGEFTITGLPADTDFILTDLSGRSIYSEVNQNSFGSLRVKIHHPGFYLLHTSTQTARLVVQ
jgi:hypothetical protein